jgi:hypothetical protein
VYSGRFQREFWSLCKPQFLRTQVLCCVDLSSVCDDLLQPSAFTHYVVVGGQLRLQVFMLFRITCFPDRRFLDFSSLCRTTDRSIPVNGTRSHHPPFILPACLHENIYKLPGMINTVRHTTVYIYIYICIFCTLSFTLRLCQYTTCFGSAEPSSGTCIKVKTQILNHVT